jgi:hypothetical protein
MAWSKYMIDTLKEMILDFQEAEWPTGGRDGLM